MTLTQELHLKTHAPGNRIYEAQCHGKVRYPTLEHAKEGARRQHKKYKRKFEAYYCRWCGQFHVGGRRR